MPFIPDRTLTPAHPNIPSYPPSSYRRPKTGSKSTTAADEMSDSGESSASPSRSAVRGRCFCGRDVVGTEGGIYCSVACARADAFSSLCYKSAPAPPSAFNFPQSSAMRESTSLASSVSTSLSRNPSTTSNTSTSTSISNASGSEDWNASHYRRLARADIRREERKEERRKRRTDSTNRSTTLSTSSSRVPDLVGGHSRNVSVASTASSAYTVGSLSRNASSASSTSSRRYGGGVHVDTVIMEDDDEEEWLTAGSDSRPYAPPVRKHHRRRGSNTGLSSGRLKQLEAFGMGKDMRDVLEEIIQMEKGFVLSDTEDRPDVSPTPGLFTAQFDRPPRTPSPMSVDKRQSVIPAAPGAPARGHRLSLSQSQSMNTGTGRTPKRPPSMMGLHQSSLSESHTALYLATASPAAPAGRRSASPKLQARKSLTFTPDKAGPSIGILRQHRFDSPAGQTPSRRRGNISPSAHHPTMDHWRFPTSGSTSNMATPTRPPPINTTNLPGSFATPVNNHGTRAVTERISPQLLWPPSGLPPPLAPALFPSSPANGTPDFLNGTATLSPNSSHAPHSGLRLGVLLGSGEMDVDMDDDDSTAHGHSVENGAHGYLPVFLEAEGFRTGFRWN